ATSASSLATTSPGCQRPPGSPPSEGDRARAPIREAGRRPGPASRSYRGTGRRGIIARSGPRSGRANCHLSREASPMPRATELRVNGAGRRVDADPERSLLSVLRDDLDLTGAKYGCGEGRCGACTVLVDGRPTRSCLAKVGNLPDKPITTVEGLARD